MSEDLIDALTQMREDDALEITRQILAEGGSPPGVLVDCRKAMDIIGQQFEKGKAFLPELILAGEMLRQISEITKPHIRSEVAAEKLGKIVIGTVQGDIHDIAKDIVVFWLEVNGFEVIDLGVDVPPSRFVEAVQETGATIVGLSGFLTLAYAPMKTTVEALRAAGPGTKVMIGGGQVNEAIRAYTGADAYGKDALAAVALAKGWVGQ